MSATSVVAEPANARRGRGRSIGGGNAAAASDAETSRVGPCSSGEDPNAKGVKSRMYDGPSVLIALPTRGSGEDELKGETSED